MATLGFALFDTAIGRCGIAWTEQGIACMQLPEATEAGTRARLRQRCPAACEMVPPPDIERTIGAIVSLLQGQLTDLGAATLDMNGISPFYRRVYEIARSIPPGATLSYGEVAQRMGSPGAARAVGQALGRNPFALIVPCHRVLSANGKLGGFSANGGTTTKQRLLSIERSSIREVLLLSPSPDERPITPPGASPRLRS